MNDPLKILGLKPGDTLKTAQKNRNALFLRFHPDKSPSDISKYQEVYNAYEILENNPELLNFKETRTATPSVRLEKTIRVKIVIYLADFYFNKKQTITIHRNVFCKKCCGTGSSCGADGYCVTCHGEGKINSSILALLDKDSTCPICHGTGVNTEKLCQKCRGTRYETETKTIQFELELQDYHKKAIALHNEGDQLNRDVFGSIIVLLDIQPDFRLKIEDNYFVVYDKILPVQKIIGDIGTIEVLGRKVKYPIEKNSTEAFVVDKISPSLSQRIRIKYIDLIPRSNAETTILYKKILEIEKQYEHTVRL